MLEKVINNSKYVNVKDLRFCNKDEIRLLKSLSYDKTYHAIVTFAYDIDHLSDITSLINRAIVQETPRRVKHRRADIVRVKIIKDI